MAGKHPGGRPTKLTDEVVQKILNAVRAGNYVETAALHAGITKETLYAWLRRANKELDRVAATTNGKIRKSELPYVQFSDSLNKAFADSEIRDVALIANAAAADWKAAAWRLERRYPAKWGRKDRIAAELEHKGSVGLSLRVSYDPPEDEAPGDDEE